MKKLITLLLLTTMLSCQDDDFQNYFVPLETCDYIPSPCDLISIETFIELSGTAPFPNANSYSIKNSGELLLELNDPDASVQIGTCEISFENAAGNSYSAYCELDCRANEINFPRDLSEITAFSNFDTAVLDNEFPDAVYFPNLEAYVIRKGAYIVELDFSQFTKAQQVEIAKAMLSNLP